MSLANLIGSYQRVVYSQNPLVEVICQVRFPALLAIDAQLPVEFQSKISDHFDDFKINQGIQVSFGADPSNLASPVQIKNYVFSDQKTGYSISLSSSDIALSTTTYSRWEDFSRMLGFVLESFLSCYKIKRATRIGLRYRDVIDREALQIKGVPWQRLLQPPVLGFLTSDLIDETEVDTLVTNCQFRTPDCKVIFQSGFVENIETKQRAFMVDYDAYIDTESTFVAEDIISSLTKIHTVTGPLFRWSITDELHNALGPKQI